MKKLLLVILMIACVGCVTVKVPKYVQSDFPYKKKFYADFQTTLAATSQALEDLNWTISDTSHPSIFEQDTTYTDQEQQVLIFTEVRQTPLFLSSKYMGLNVYVRAAGDSTDVEIRYVAVTPVFFKHAKNYRNDAVVNKIFNRISWLLEQ